MKDDIQIEVDEEEVRIAFGRMIWLKDSIEKNTEFDMEGAGANYKQGLMEGIDACIKYMKKAVKHI